MTRVMPKHSARCASPTRCSRFVPTGRTLCGKCDPTSATYVRKAPAPRPVVDLAGDDWRPGRGMLDRRGALEWTPILSPAGRAVVRWAGLAVALATAIAACV